MGMSLAVIKGASEPVAPFAIDLSGIKDTYDDIRRAQGELGTPMRPYRAKMPSGGGKTFEIVTGTPEDDAITQKFCGVVIYNYKCNARFDKDDKTNKIPFCASYDGLIGTETDTGEAYACRNCPYNEFGSAANGRGKACTNAHRLYILTEGSAIPVLLTLPPTSLNPWANYRYSLASKHLKPFEAVTEFSLEQRISAGGDPYSVVKFALKGALEGEAKAVAEYFAANFAQTEAAATEIDGDDYNRGEVPAQ